MEPLTICVNSQTPLLQFLPPPEDTPGAAWPGSARLDEFDEGVEYRFSPGGVTRMVYPLLRRLLANGVLAGASWVALNSVGPRQVRADGLTLENVALDPLRMGGYAKTKEAIWSTVHGLEPPPAVDDLFWSEEFTEYAFYNRVTAERIRKLDADLDFDAFYIHDFQQMPVGQMLGSLKPKIFRWHIPFEAERIPESWRELFVSYLAEYDVVVVSTERYRAALTTLGYEGKSLRMYPYVDPREYRRPTKKVVEATCARWGVRPDDLVILVVARMDPTKAHDRAIQAVAKLVPAYPTVRLVLVGNGSFSAASGGLGLSKAARWRAHLEAMAHRLGVGERVIFTGHVGQEALDCFYERAQFTVLPSVNEGFGLVVVESWLHRRPALVTERAGIAELIQDGENGILFDPDDIGSLAQKMRELLDDDGTVSARLAQNALVTSKLCTLARAARGEAELLAMAIEA
ncbi:MAG: glycosyltransferase family 4 protein [Thermoplasmata archaeon]|nr:glycosyltransferase family 4 protein [Thermoplasmata archaeon]